MSDLKKKSDLTVEGMGRAPNRAMLRSVHMQDEDFAKPIIGVANLHSDITPCNAHLGNLAQKG
ncbi:MAG: dihydroxy-acid dehydratase, partial [Planctomycetes bacterium]|nr:dihydroxy-acid dehydratase [Planctomycetota bacterium]